MNNRIQELIEQAGIYQSERFDCINGTNQLEKLAKLIAAECADLAADIDGGENMISRGIRERFEV